MPIVRLGNRKEVMLQGHRYLLESEEEVRQMERRIAGHDYYSVRVNQDQMAGLLHESLVLKGALHRVSRNSMHHA